MLRSVRLVRLSPGVVVLTALLVGCGGSSDEGTGTGAAGSDADADRATSTTAVPRTATDSASGGCLDEVDNAAAPASHADPGTELAYGGLPPVSGVHWSHWPNITARVYAVDERPELGELVHSQEHGWTVVWYDATIAEDDAAMSALEAASAAVNGAHRGKVVLVPWTSGDGEAFPGGTHVALTHWGAADGGLEYRQFCVQPSDDQIRQFSVRHPSSDAFEPNGP